MAEQGRGSGPARLAVWRKLVSSDLLFLSSQYGSKDHWYVGFEIIRTVSPQTAEPKSAAGPAAFS
jgi:hypothetical protein